MTKQPVILGSNSEEGSLFVPFSVNGTGITPAKIKAVTDAAVQCSVATTSQYVFSRWTPEQTT